MHALTILYLVVGLDIFSSTESDIIESIQCVNRRVGCQNGAGLL